MKSRPAILIVPFYPRTGKYQLLNTLQFRNLSYMILDRILAIIRGL